MSKRENFIVELEKSVSSQLKSRNVGYLFGAGASYFNGAGFPLSFTIWDVIKDNIPEDERDEIQAKLEEDGTEGLEHALDLLDPGGPEPTRHRHSVTAAIANCFSHISPPITAHQTFLKRASRRIDSFVPIFTLNYDPLMELASDAERLAIIDGFSGFFQASFNPNNYDFIPSRYDNKGANRVLRGNNGILHLYKLHGSTTWFMTDDFPIRIAMGTPLDEAWRRLMIPPQYRKATETTTQPYSAIWSRFRAWLIYGPRALNRLVCIGYGMRDQHVNDIIENATSRGDFTLLIFAKTLTDECFNQWAVKENVIIVTNDCCSHFGEVGPGHDSLWDFEALCKEV
jgi:hypothetical protein